MAKINSLTEKINGGNNPLFQELYGTDSSVLKEQADRYASLMSDFEKSYGTNDVQLFTSPGRTEIGGNHTDHNYGRVLAGAVNLDNIAVAAKNGTNTIRIKSTGYPEFQVELTDFQPE
jgi:galactokinase